MRAPLCRVAAIRPDGRLVRLTGRLRCRAASASIVDAVPCFCARVALLEMTHTEDGKPCGFVEADAAPLSLPDAAVIVDETGALPVQLQKPKITAGATRELDFELSSCPPALSTAFSGWLEGFRRQHPVPRVHFREQLVATDQLVTLWGFGAPAPDGDQGPRFVALRIDPPRAATELLGPLAALTACGGLLIGALQVLCALLR